MNTIDSYSVFKHIAGTKTKHLLYATTEHYEPLHRQSKRAKDIPLYLTAVPDAVHSLSERKPSKTLSGAGGVYITGLYFPDPEKPHLAYGDIKGTDDAVLAIIKDSQIEIFICKGKKTVSPQLLMMLADGDPDMLAEMEDHRHRTQEP